MNAISKLAVIFSAVAIVVPQAGAAKSPSKSWAGTWHLNTDKSKFSSPDFAMKSDTRTYTVSGDRITMKSATTTAAGKMMKWGYSAPADGKWHPVTGNPNADQIALTLVSDREVNSQTRLKGKPSAKATATLSADGKQLTLHRSILTAKGGPTDDMVVYDRVK